MKLVRWSFHNIHMPMMENEEGELYCTSKMLCNSESKVFFREHRTEFVIRCSIS